MMDFIKKHKYLFISLGIVILIFSYFIIFNDSIFLFAGDSYEQQYKFYVEGWKRLRDGSLPFWDWSIFLGNNYFGASTFYFLCSPFFWLAMLLPKVEWMQYVFVYLNLLKSLICVTFTYMWLYKINKDSLSASIGGLIVTFSSYILFNYTNNHIFDAICFIPLCLYFSECYLQDKKTLGLSLSIGYLGIISYYYLYLFIPFACIYALIRYLTINDRAVFKNILKDGGIYVLRIILGVLISCVTLLPSYLALQGNPRSLDLSLSFNTVGKLTYYRFLTSFLTPLCDWRLNFNSFVSININQGIGWGGGFADYSLMLSVYCVVLLAFIKNKKVRISGYALFGVYAIFAMFPIFYILFNQNYESRWAYIFTFILAYIASIVISNRRDISRKEFIISGTIVLLIIGGCYLITNYFELNDVEWEKEFLSRNCIVLSVFIVLYILLGIFNKLSLEKYLLFVIVLGEIVFSLYSTFYGTNNSFYEPMSKELINEYNDSYKSAVELIKEKDNSFYRIDKDKLYDSLGGNDVYLQRYKSFYSYHSVYNYNQQAFINDRFSSSWLFHPQTGKDILKTMLGCKYWFTYEKEGDYLVPYGYSYYASTDDGATIYKNDYPITFAYFRDKETSVEDFNELDTLHQDYLMLENVILDNIAKSDTFNNYHLEQISLNEEEKIIDISNDGMFYIVYTGEELELPFWSRPNWHIYDSNNNELYSNHVDNELGYVGLNVDINKYRTLDIRHISRSKVYYDDMSWYDDWYKSQVMVDPDSVKWDDNSISGTITTTKDGYIVTSVPYDKGWNVKLDGKKIDYLKVNEGFVGFTITPGTHTIEMNYVPPGLLVGSIISIVSLAICLLLWKKKNNK